MQYIQVVRKRCFRQLRGLAMAQRLAPVLAICFMSKIEQPVLERFPLLYCRYIDDCCVVTSTQSEMDECFRLLNAQSQYIRFTREPPQNGWLPYLNTQIKLTNGIIRVKWFRKQNSKKILINARSAHPTAVKRAVLRNMFKTATGMCTDAERQEESRKLASRIANENGYAQQRKRRMTHPNNQNVDRQNKLPLCVPFICDHLSAAIQQVIARAQ